MAKPRSKPSKTPVQPKTPWNAAFKAWLKRSGMKHAEVAFKCDVSVVSVFEWTRETMASERKRLLVEVLSKGDVPANIAAPRATAS